FNERAAINARLQGTAADIIRRAMVRIEGALAKAKLTAQMLLQVHDELVFEVLDAEVEKTLPVIERVMAQAPMPALSLSVPLAVEARAAHNWDEAHCARAYAFVLMHSGATRPGCRHPLPALRSVAATLIGILAPGPAQAAAGLDGAGLTWFWALPFIGILLTIATGPLLFPRF